MREDLGRLLQTPGAAVRRATRFGRRTSSPLEGRVVMVTGASSGIGRATALAVGRRGATVLLVARRVEALMDVADEIFAAGGHAVVHPCDLTDGVAVDALVLEVLAEHGAVDYLVNNAGRSIRRSLALTHGRFHDFERMMAVNYFGAVRLTMGLVPAMRDQGFGHVVNIVSWGVQTKATKFAPYLASKTALDTFGRIAGRELWADGITFTNVRFGLVLTPMVGPTNVEGRRSLTPDQAAAKVVRALEDRPLTIGTTAGRAYAVLNVAAPRLSDALHSRMHRRSPDSPAAVAATLRALPQPREHDAVG